MIDRRTVFEIHRLKNLGYSFRKIAQTLRISRESAAKYWLDPQLLECKKEPPGPAS